MPHILVGVDAGASHTVAALAHGEEVVRTVIGGAANPNAGGGVHRAADTIARTVGELLGGERAAAIGVGAAGAGSDEVRTKLYSELQTRFPDMPIAVTDDAHIALRAAIPRHDGMVLIAGTGSIAYANVAGRCHWAGGYGYLFGDEGSGYAIGASALRRFLAADENEAPRDPLLNALAMHFNVVRARDVLGSIYGSTMPVATVAGCAPVVLEQASAGVPTATEIVENTAAALFGLVERVVASVSGPRRDSSLQLAFSGGLFKEPNILADSVEQRIAAELPNLRILSARRESYLGALAEARGILSIA